MESDPKKNLPAHEIYYHPEVQEELPLPSVRSHHVGQVFLIEVFRSGAGIRVLDVVGH